MSVRCGCIVGPKEASRPLAQDLSELEEMGEGVRPLGRKVGTHVKGGGRQGMEARQIAQSQGEYI